jgi:hypothetical protein
MEIPELGAQKNPDKGDFSLSVGLTRRSLERVLYHQFPSRTMTLHRSMDFVEVAGREFELEMRIFAELNHQW